MEKEILSIDEYVKRKIIGHLLEVSSGNKEKSYYT